MRVRDQFLTEPPPDHAPPRTHAALAAELRDHPGMWRYVGEYSSRGGACAMASVIRTGRRQAWRRRPRGRYQSYARTTRRGRHEVYACWVPDITTTGGTPR